MPFLSTVQRALSILLLSAGVIVLAEWSPVRGSEPQETATVRLVAEPTATGEPAAPVARPADEAVAEGVRLRGVLLSASDRAPVPGASVAFHFAGGYVQVKTDSEGRFESSDHVVAGTVRPWHLADPSNPELANHLDIEPDSFLVDVESGVFEVELLLVLPAAWVEVEVIGVDGAPVAGATVQAVLTRQVEPGTGPVSAGQHPTRENGRARIAVYEGPSGAELRLHARFGGELVSRKRTVTPPWPPGPVRLVLLRGGRIRATLVDAEGAPMVGRFVGVLADSMGTAPDVGLTPTDGDGVALFPVLPEGAYRVFHYDEAVRRTYETEVLVPAGRVANARIEERIPLERAAAGRVVDETGAPLADVSVRLSRAGEDDLVTTTGGDGEFAFDAPRTESVSVGPRRTPWADEYDPAAVDVPFGTAELVFRRVGVLPETEFAVEIVDGLSGEPVREAVVIAHRTGSSGEFDLHHVPDGAIDLSYKVHTDLAFCVQAEGFERRIVEVGRLAAENGVLRVELEPGFARSLQVRHQASDEPLMGARVFAGDELVGRSGPFGHVELELGDWPDELRIEARGHEPTTRDPRDWLTELEDPIVWLAPGAGHSRDG